MKNRWVKVCQMKRKGLERSLRIVTLSHVNSEWFTLEMNSGPQGEKKPMIASLSCKKYIKSFEETL